MRRGRSRRPRRARHSRRRPRGGAIGECRRPGAGSEERGDQRPASTRRRAIAASPTPRAGGPTSGEAAEHAQHPGELERVEPHGGARAALIVQDRRSSPPTMTSVWRGRSSTRPSTSTGNGPALHRSSIPASRSAGAAASDVARRRVGEDAPPARPRPSARSRSAPARSPSCQSAQTLRAGDLGQERAEGADADGAGEDDQAQQRRAGADALTAGGSGLEGAVGPPGVEGRHVRAGPRA